MKRRNKDTERSTGRIAIAICVIMQYTAEHTHTYCIFEMIITLLKCITYCPALLYYFTIIMTKQISFDSRDSRSPFFILSASVCSFIFEVQLYDSPSNKSQYKKNYSRERITIWCSRIESIRRACVCILSLSRLISFVCLFIGVVVVVVFVVERIKLLMWQSVAVT